MERKEWYVLKVRVGREKEVIRIIKGMIKGGEMFNLVGDMISDNLVKGYVYIEMVKCEKLINRIEKIESSRGFVKFNGSIEEMSENDIELVKGKLVS